MEACLIIILCSIFFLIGFHQEKTIWAPTTLVPGLWLLCMLLWVFVPHILPNLSTHFISCLSIWISGFWFAALISSGKRSQQSSMPLTETNEPSLLVRNMLWIVSAIYCLQLYQWAHTIAAQNPFDVFTSLRLAAVGKLDEDETMYGGIQVFVWLALYAVELFYSSKGHYSRAIITGIFYLSFSALTVSKAGLLNMAVITVFILQYKHVIKWRHMLIIGALVLVSFFFMQTAREVEMQNTWADTLIDNLTLYIFAGFCAFDSLIPESATMWGENTFAFVYRLLARFDSSIIPVNPILPWVEDPYPTNTYTIMYPYFVDFGIVGIIIFSIINGVFIGFIYRKSHSSSFWLIIYAYFIISMVMQYAAEMIFTNMEGFIYFTIILFFIYFFKQPTPTIQREQQ